MVSSQCAMWILSVRQVRQVRQLRPLLRANMREVGVQHLYKQKNKLYLVLFEEELYIMNGGLHEVVDHREVNVSGVRVLQGSNMQGFSRNRLSFTNTYHSVGAEPPLLEYITLLFWFAVL